MKYCGEQGCKQLIAHGYYCSSHARKKRKPSKGKTYKHANKQLYNTAAWKALSDFVYERDKGCCQRCGKFVHGRRAHRHHVIPVSKAPELALVSSNIKLLCSVCHPIEEEEAKGNRVPDYFNI